MVIAPNWAIQQYEYDNVIIHLELLLFMIQFKLNTQTLLKPETCHTYEHSVDVKHFYRAVLQQRLH